MWPQQQKKSNKKSTLFKIAAGVVGLGLLSWAITTTVLYCIKSTNNTPTEPTTPPAVEQVLPTVELQVIDSNRNQDNGSPLLSKKGDSVSLFAQTKNIDFNFVKTIDYKPTFQTQNLIDNNTIKLDNSSWDSMHVLSLTVTNDIDYDEYGNFVPVDFFFSINNGSYLNRDGITLTPFIDRIIPLSAWKFRNKSIDSGMGTGPVVKMFDGLDSEYLAAHPSKNIFLVYSTVHSWDLDRNVPAKANNPWAYDPNTIAILYNSKNIENSSDFLDYHYNWAASDFVPQFTNLINEYPQINTIAFESNNTEMVPIANMPNIVNVSLPEQMSLNPKYAQQRGSIATVLGLIGNFNNMPNLETIKFEHSLIVNDNTQYDAFPNAYPGLFFAGCPKLKFVSSAGHQDLASSVVVQNDNVSSYFSNSAHKVDIQGLLASGNLTLNASGWQDNTIGNLGNTGNDDDRTLASGNSVLFNSAPVKKITFDSSATKLTNTLAHNCYSLENIDAKNLTTFNTRVGNDNSIASLYSYYSSIFPFPLWGVGKTKNQIQDNSAWNVPTEISNHVVNIDVTQGLQLSVNNSIIKLGNNNLAGWGSTNLYPRKIYINVVDSGATVPTTWTLDAVLRKTPDSEFSSTLSGPASEGLTDAQMKNIVTIRLKSGTNADAWTAAFDSRANVEVLP